MHTRFSVHHVGPAWGPKWKTGPGIYFEIIEIIEMIEIIESCFNKR